MAESSTPSTDGKVELIYVGNVLERDGWVSLCFGPEVFSGGGAPLCQARVAVTGWDWQAAGPSQISNGDRFGVFTVHGVLDGKVFRLTRTAEPPQTSSPTDPVVEPWAPVTRCPAPEGGWRIIDPLTSTRAALDATGGRAEALAGPNMFWLDYSIVPRSPDRPLDPSERLVVNVPVDGDPTPVEAELRKTWGGALCVYRMTRSLAELEAIAHELTGLGQPPVLSAEVDPVTETVTAQVLFDDGSLQDHMEREHGAGAVRVKSQLRRAPVR